MFSFTRFWSIVDIRNKAFYRDIGALGWVFLFPLLTIMSFSYIFNMDSTDVFKVGTYENLTRPQIAMAKWVEFESKGDALEKLKNFQVDMVVSFTEKTYWLPKGSPKSKAIKKLFLYEQLPTQYQEKYIKGQDISYVQWLFPGLLALNVMFMALWGVGWVIVRQRRLGILKRYKVSPLTAFEYIFAQMISRLFILILSGGIVYAGSLLLHPIRMVGSYIDLIVIYVLGCLSLSSVGLIVAARMSSDEMVNGILNLLTFPMMFLSEVWFSLEGSQDWVKTLAQCMPLWHMSNGMRKIMLEGATLADLGQSLWILLITAGVFMAFGSYLFQWNSNAASRN